MKVYTETKLALILTTLVIIDLVSSYFALQSGRFGEAHPLGFNMVVILSLILCPLIIVLSKFQFAHRRLVQLLLIITICSKVFVLLYNFLLLEL